MSFTIDKQTLNDLNIFGKSGQKSIFAIYNNAKTYGGTKVLESIFSYPLSEYDKIKDRVNIIKHFADAEIEFPFVVDMLDSVESYINETDRRTQLNSNDNIVNIKLRELVGVKTSYPRVKHGVMSTIKLIARANEVFLSDMLISIADSYKDLAVVRKLLQSPSIKWISECASIKKPSYKQLMELDEQFRFNFQADIKQLLSSIFYMDAYISLAKVGRARKYNYAEVIESDKNILYIEDMFHPYVPNAVPNSVKLDEDSNIVFLTGANMAGKSTFMKCMGIIVYLAHIGVPLPVNSMKFTPKNGLYTTINLPDNMSMGYSHFYADVLRVRKVAEHISRESNIMVIFDELFRGTNVKDAFDATVAVTEAFASNRRCTLMISTHIIECGEVIKRSCNNIKYLYLPTIMRGDKPVYTYKIEEGITSDRHGMVIIRNESIIEMLNEGLTKKLS